MKQYYIVSLKHTSKGDTALTFWCANGCGYTLHKDRAGLYTQEEARKHENENNIKVLKELVDPFWMNALDFKDKYISVPNNKTVLHHLGLSDKEMKPKKFATCRMTFINTPAHQTSENEIRTCHTDF
jgi:hypothetical protein